MEGLEHQVVSTERKPIHPDNVISPLCGSDPSDPRRVKQLACYNSAHGITERDPTPKLTDSSRTNPTESKDNQFRDARVRQLDEASLLKPMKWHRSYFNQGRECGKAGNRFVVDVPDFIGINMDINLEMIVCVPFQTHCHSAACRHKREVC